MNEWLEANKTWVFSGIGVTVITAVVAVFSSAIVYWFRGRSERRIQKRLALRPELRQYRIAGAGADDPLTVSYKGQLYDDLCQFYITVENAGVPGINAQQLLFRFPSDADIVDIHKSFNTQTVSADNHKLEEGETIEHLWEIHRLESGDTATFTYIVNTREPAAIRCDPRGVDDVDYVYSGAKSVPDNEEKLIVSAALFVLAGAIPFIGGVVQAGVILVSSPIIIAVARRLNIRPDHRQTCMITDVTVEDGGKFRVLQE